MEKGMIHLYTGEGKGKTTAALGLSFRAAGSGLRVLFVQFQKGRDTGELSCLAKCGIEVWRNSRDFGFIKNMSEKERTEIRTENDSHLDGAVKMAWEGAIDVLVLDELMSAYNNELISRENVRQLVLKKPERLELVLTGRNADDFFVENCDYLTQMTCVRHPFAKGITARKGIEY